jgi:methylthioribose-1-phosphate isomerase
LSLLKPGFGLLTHCNAGTIATSKYGTALAPIYLGQEKGYDFKVYADETRPLLQGARLTAWELQEAGVDVTLICDNMASIVMKEGRIQAVLVGCDRVAENGDAANKIGTLGVSIIAKKYNVPFYVCAPSSTIDMKTPTGADIVIEQRKPEEVTDMWYEERMAPCGINVYNPAFDVTDHDLITAVITEHGVVYPPFEENFRKIFNK